ncbi:glycosyltransferase family 2 protein [Microbulbifer sediminum]|uniref:glycosyltransferase family 2 protein n=1 Tax=Microbulbifer sediminum TaxID=2904250 RepID=UPI001F184809|nr:glycosyltransferase [Microbulbifer sediminum]
MISVIVPVFDQWDLIPHLLDRLAKQSIGLEAFEVILIDNGTPGFVEPALDFPGKLVVLDCDKPGAYAARNAGINQSKGEWLAFTDADCLPLPSWLENLFEVASLDGTENIMLAGRVDVVPNSNKPGPYEIYDVVKGIPQDLYVKGGYAATANLFVPRSLVDSLGGFKERLYSGADKDFCLRAVRKGASLAYVDGAKVGHRARFDWAGVATKARRLKGGQFYSSSGLKRLLAVLRTFMPPITAVQKVFRAKDHSLSYRMIAIFVQLRLWPVESVEILRLSVRGKPERK